MFIEFNVKRVWFKISYISISLTVQKTLGFSDGLFNQSKFFGFWNLSQGWAIFGGFSKQLGGKKLNCFWFQDKQNELSRITEKPNSVTKADPSLLEFRNFMKGGVSIFLRLNA